MKRKFLSDEDYQAKLRQDTLTRMSEIEQAVRRYEAELPDLRIAYPSGETRYVFGPSGGF